MTQSASELSTAARGIADAVAVSASAPVSTATSDAHGERPSRWLDTPGYPASLAPKRRGRSRRLAIAGLMAASAWMVLAALIFFSRGA